jgi:hypothetical protein
MTWLLVAGSILLGLVLGAVLACALLDRHETRSRGGTWPDVGPY